MTPSVTARVPSQAGAVLRSHLLGRVSDPSAPPFVQITAPAGYGKSTLLEQWRAVEPRPMAVIGLTAADDEPVRLAGRLLRALDEVEPVGGAALAALEAPIPDVVDGARERIVDTLRGRTRPTVVAVDDAHLLTSPSAVEVLRIFAEHTAAGSTFAIVARRPARFPRGRLRVSRGMLEFATADLALSSDEAAALLAAEGLDVSQALSTALWRRTEGWPAGLYLAGRAASRAADPTASLGRFAGTSSDMAEYLAEEVLAHLTDEQLGFLTRAAILERLTGPCCDAVLGRNESGALLTTIAAEHQLVQPVPDDHGAYRCHALLRDALRARLAAEGPDAERELHRSAHDWFLDAGDLDRAAEHAVASGDAELAGALLWDHVPYFCSQGRTAMTLRRIQGFPARRVERSPLLAMVAATAAITMGDLQQAERWRQAALLAADGDTDAPGATPLRVASLILEATACAHGIERMAQDAREGYELDRPGSPWRSFACLVHGIARHLAGDPADARPWLEEAILHAAVAVPTIEGLALAQLALVTVDTDRAAAAEELVDRALARVDASLLGAYPTSALDFAAAALVHAAVGRSEEARRELVHAEQLLGRLGGFSPWYLAEVRVVLARAAILLADAEQARRLLADASRAAHRVTGAVTLAAWVDRAWGDLDDAAAAALDDVARLTMAELRVLRFLPTHLSFREIGLRLHVSANTVKTQARAIYRKLGVGSRSEAVARARRLGLLES